MRKIFTLFVFCLLGAQGFSQSCAADSEASFITCTQTMGVTEITITNGTPDPLTIDAVVNLSGITVVVPNQFLIIFNTDFIADAGTEFTGQGQSQIRVLGVTYIGNEGSGDTFSDLNTLFDNCTPDPELGGCSVTQLLPVELTRFEARPQDEMIELSWTTATELNNDFFQVEHSRNGIDFYAVGKVKGEGTTTETVNYDFTHRQPITGTNYYRLKQVDYDGAFEYSDVVVAELRGRAGGVQIFPNPTNAKAVIQMPKQPEQIQFRLSNLVGQTIDLQPTLAGGGWELDLQQLPKGIYLLRLDYDGKTVSKRIVKE